MTAGRLEARIEAMRDDRFEVELDLDIEPGETVALLGPNGAGKSTVVAVLAGLLPLRSGWARLGDRVLDDPSAGVFVPPEKRRIGVVFQDYVLFPHLSVTENVSFGLRARGVGAAEAMTRSWLDRLGLGDLAGHRPAQLSGGQAQRVALARALITEPDLLLLDEPLSALDVTTRNRLRQELARHLAEFDGPRLLITHDPGEAFLLADRIQVMEAGRVTQAGSPDDIRLRPRTSYAADLAGLNLFHGVAADGMVTVGEHTLHVADSRANGRVLASVSPRAVSIHRHRPEGSPRNTWETVVVLVEDIGERVRLQMGDPLPLVAEITPEARGSLALEPGALVWVSIKATEIVVEDD